jgi:hypothetical protein
MLNTELLDEVGHGLYARCLSIRDATDAYFGTVHCPACEAVFGRPTPCGPDTVLRCAACGWARDWKSYYATIRGKHLLGKNFMPVLAEFIANFAACREPKARLQLIDTLIHTIHKGSCKTAAVNFLRGNAGRLRRFLDGLAYDENMPPQVLATRSRWRSDMAQYDRLWGDGTPARENGPGSGELLVSMREQ